MIDLNLFCINKLDTHQDRNHSYHKQESLESFVLLGLGEELGLEGFVLHDAVVGDQQEQRLDFEYFPLYRPHELQLQQEPDQPNSKHHPNAGIEQHISRLLY